MPESDIKPEVSEEVLNKALEAKLKELGYDENAKVAIHKRNEEAKEHRQRAEKAEAALKQREEADAAAKAEADATKAKAEAEAKKKADEEKPLKEQLTAVEKAFQAELEKRDEADKKRDREYQKELKARDEAIRSRAIREAALKAGIIDPDLIDLFDHSKVTMEKGTPKAEEIDLLIETIKTEKPLYFRKAEEGNQLDRDFRRPAPKVGKEDTRDASKLDDNAFNALADELRHQRV